MRNFQPSAAGVGALALGLALLTAPKTASAETAVADSLRAPPVPAASANGGTLDPVSTYPTDPAKRARDLGLPNPEKWAFGDLAMVETYLASLITQKPMQELAANMDERLHALNPFAKLDLAKKLGLTELTIGKTFEGNVDSLNQATWGDILKAALGLEGTPTVNQLVWNDLLQEVGPARMAEKPVVSRTR